MLFSWTEKMVELVDRLQDEKRQYEKRKGPNSLVKEEERSKKLWTFCEGKLRNLKPLDPVIAARHLISTL